MQNGPTETNAALEFAVNSLEVSKIILRKECFGLHTGRYDVLSANSPRKGQYSLGP